MGLGALLVKSLDLHRGREEEGLRKHQDTRPDRQEMLLVLGWLRQAQERGLSCWAFRLKLLLSKVLVYLFACVVSAAISQAYLQALLCCTCPTSQKNGSYQQIQSPNTLLPQIWDPISSTTTRLVPPPLLAVGPQVEQGHDKLTSGERWDKGGRCWA